MTVSIFFHANGLILQGCLLAFYYFRWYYVRELTSELKNYLKIISQYRRDISAACRLSFLYEKPVNKFPLNFNLPFRPSLRSITIAVCFLPASSPKTPDINDNLYLRLGRTRAVGSVIGKQVEVEGDLSTPPQDIFYGIRRSNDNAERMYNGAPWIMTMFQAECQRMPVRRKVVGRTTFVHSFVIVMHQTSVSRVPS